MSPIAPFPRFKPGARQISAGILNKMQDAIERLSRTVYDANFFSVTEPAGGIKTVSVNPSALFVDLNVFFKASINATTKSTLDISAGYGCYAGTWTEISDGTGTITEYMTDGTSYASVKLDLAAGTWSLEKTDTSLPTNTDSEQFWVLAKVTVASDVISAIEQRWFGGWAIYETRA